MARLPGQQTGAFYFCFDDVKRQEERLVLDLRLFLSLSDLKEYRLFTPDDIEWRPAS